MLEARADAQDRLIKDLKQAIESAKAQSKEDTEKILSAINDQDALVNQYKGAKNLLGYLIATVIAGLGTIAAFLRIG